MVRSARAQASRAAVALLVTCAVLVPAGRADAPSEFAVAREGHIAVVRLGGDGGLVVVDIDDGALLQRVSPGERVTTVDITPRGDLVAALTETGTLILWHWREAEVIRSQPFGPVAISEEWDKRITDLCFAPDGERLLVGLVGGEAKVVTRTGALLGKVRGVRKLWLHDSIMWDAKGQRLAYVDAAGLSVVDARTFEPLQTESGAVFTLRPTSRIECFDFHPSAPRIATGHADARIRVTDLTTGAEVQVFEHDDPFWGPPPKEPADADPFNDMSIGWLAFSRDGTRLAYTTVSAVHLGCFDLARGERVAMSPFAGGRMGTPATIAWGPRDRCLYYAFWGGSSTLTWVWFGAGQRYGEVAAPGCTPEFGAGTRGVFLSQGRLRAIDGVSGELAWTLDSRTLANGELQPPR
jgi:WD40 repeat protein